MQVMVLAAGLGTRLQPYTFIRPKPLFPVLNRPLLNILLDMLKAEDCNPVVVNGHHLADQVKKVVEERAGINFQHEPEILGTGGSLRQALPVFDDEPVLVMNGDIFHNIDLFALYEYHIQSGNRITMAMHDQPRFNSVGVEGDTIRTFRSHMRKTQEKLAFTGIHVVDPSIIKMIPAGSFFHIIDLYEELIQKGEKIGYLRVDGSFWEDIGTPEVYLGLHAKLLKGKIGKYLPVTLPEDSWLINTEVRMKENVRLSGWGCIGKAKIGTDVRLRNCVVWDGSVIADGMHFENEIITPG